MFGPSLGLSLFMWNRDYHTHFTGLLGGCPQYKVNRRQSWMRGHWLLAEGVVVITEVAAMAEFASRAVGGRDQQLLPFCYSHLWKCLVTGLSWLLPCLRTQAAPWEAAPSKAAAAPLPWILELVWPNLHTACPAGGQGKPQIFPHRGLRQHGTVLRKSGAGVLQTWIPNSTCDSTQTSPQSLWAPGALALKCGHWELPHRLAVIVKWVIRVEGP